MSTIMSTRVFKQNHKSPNLHLCKIFVGNVPYQCSQNEFAECFENVDGFVKADIMIGHKSNISRGFGFVTLNSFDNAEKLKMRKDIIFKGRQLRFTNYQQDSARKKYEKKYNYVFVTGIPNEKNKMWLKKCFEQYGPIGKCFISMDRLTGEYQNNGVIEILDDLKYKAILNKKNHTFDANVILETTKYKPLSISKFYFCQ